MQLCVCVCLHPTDTLTQHLHIISSCNTAPDFTSEEKGELWGEIISVSEYWSLVFNKMIRYEDDTPD